MVTDDWELVDHVHTWGWLWSQHVAATTIRHYYCRFCDAEMATTERLDDV